MLKLENNTYTELELFFGRNLQVNIYKNWNEDKLCIF